MKKYTHEFLNPKNITIKLEPGYNYRLYIPDKTLEGLSKSEISLIKKISEKQKLEEMLVVDFIKTQGILVEKKFKLKKRK